MIKLGKGLFKYIKLGDKIHRNGFELTINVPLFKKLRDIIFFFAGQ